MATVTDLTPVNSSNWSSAVAEDIERRLTLPNLLLRVILSCFCVITVFGNVLVIYAVIQERYLKSATYYYMASLACADLFVGLIVMPFAIVQVIYGEYWPFSPIFCDLWHSFDVCASTASILDLCIIALDRYSAITNPISYHRTFLVKRWPYLLVTVWLCSALLSFPAMGYWRLAIHQNETHSCLFPDDIYFILISSLISFYIPLFVMIFVYIQIYSAAIKQLHAFKTGVKVATSIKPRRKKIRKDQDVTATGVSQDICLRIHRGKYHGIQVDGESSITDNSLSYCSTLDNSHMAIHRKQVSMNKSRQSFGTRLSKFSKEQKATITLAYVMGIFVICWLPYFVYNPLTAVAKLFVHSKDSLNRIEQFLVGNSLIFQLFTWLGYMNSSVNPIIYAYSSREFRRAFIKYLCRCMPARVRRSLMSYHRSQLIRYSHTRASSLISAENLESNSDHKQTAIQTPSSIPATILINIQNKAPSKLCLITKYSHANGHDATADNEKPRANVLVEYCTYHDVAISRVTCL